MINSPKISTEKPLSSSSSSKPKKSMILRLLPKAAVSFQNPPFSPGRADGASQKLKSYHHHKGFSGPIMIPAEARTKPKSFETQEPTSPKVSCMGQIKHKKKICKKQPSLPRGFKPVLGAAQPEKTGKARPVGPAADGELKKKPSALMRMFSGRRKSDACKPPLPERAPSLSQMRRFASSRDTFSNFDWTRSQIAPEDGGDFYSGEDSDGEDDDLSFIPFSAPILVASARAGLELEPRKEINLWKRRTMAQPKPLQLEKCHSNIL